MASNLTTGDELGHILVQVQEDLRRLKKSLNEGAETFDIQALDAAICRTENGIRRRAEEYLKTVNKQVLMLPCIENPEKKTVRIARWKPPLESIPDIIPQKWQTDSPGEKHKTAFTLRLVCNPLHPKNRELLQENYGIQLPDLHNRSGTKVGLQRVLTGATAASLAVVPARSCLPLYLPPEQNIQAGTADELQNAVPANSRELCSAQIPIQPKAAHLHHRRDGSLAKTGVSERSSKQRKNGTWVKDVAQGQSKTAPEDPSMKTTHTPPPSAASMSSAEPRSLVQGLARLSPLNTEGSLILESTAFSRFSFSISGGRIDPAADDFLRFKQHHCLCWASLQEALWQLEGLLRAFAVPLARVCGERLAALARGDAAERAGRGRGRGAGVAERLLSALENREEVRALLQRPGQRYRGEGGTEAAALTIQASWRRHAARRAYLLWRGRQRAAGAIGLAWLLHLQIGRVRRSLRASRLRHLENYRSRTQLAANWKHIRSCRRTIIHIPSLGYSEQHRHRLRGFDILQNTQMGRLCDVRDQQVEVIYVAPVRLGEEVCQYYAQLLALQGAVGQEGPTTAPTPCTKRFTILTPEAREHFPTRNMCTSTMLKYSPHTLRRIRHLIQGKQAYIVGGVVHADDLAVADELGVPVLGPEPSVAQLYGTKSGGRRVFIGAGVSVPPGQHDIYTLQQLHECLAQLMAAHPEVRRWLFKMDGELCGRGTAHCDVSHLSGLAWAQRESSSHRPQSWSQAWAQESIWVKLLEEVPELLACYAQPVNKTCYPTWATFLQHFLRQGGVIEAYPPSDSVTCLTADVLVEPDGGVQTLSCGDQLRGSSGMEVLGCSLPQTSVCPAVLHDVCQRVGRACLQRGILGHVSLDLVTFLDPETLEQQLWAVDLDLGYSNQLAMTQLTLFMTGGTLHCRASRLELPVAARDPATRPPQPGAKANAVAASTSCYAVMVSRLLHTNLRMVHYSVFFQICKAHGIGFDIKERQGTAIALYDSKERHSLGMVTICKDLQGALLTFARNLSVIHQEVSTQICRGRAILRTLSRR